MNGMPNIPNFEARSLINNAVSFGGAALINGAFGKKWGIYNQVGVPVLLADSVVGLTYDAGATISNVPIEKGSFASYNKVNNPSMATVQLNKSTGGPLERGAFLTQLELYKSSTTSFYIVTPEYVYQNYQIIGLNYSRAANDGCTLIKANIDLQEVIEARIDYDLEEVKQPEDSNTKDGGSKQAQQEPENSVLYDIVNGKRSLF